MRAASIILSLAFSAAILAIAAAPIEKALARSPSREAVDLLGKGYNPAIQVRELSREEKGLDGWATCQIRKLEIKGKDPLDEGQNLISVRMFRPRVLGALIPDSRAVIVLPPLGGVSPLEDAYSLALCALGFRAVVLENWSPHSRDQIALESHDHQAIRAVTAVRHIVEFISPSRMNQVGILGTSAGAIMGALTVGFEPRLSAAAFIVGGGGLADILATSTESSLSELREKRMRKFGYRDVEEYRQALKRSILIDPLDFVNFSGPKKILTLVAEQDRMVPTANQWALYRAFGSQDLLVYNGPHRAAIADAFLSRHRDFVSFFDTHLK